MRAATSYLMRQVGVRRLESFKAADHPALNHGKGCTHVSPNATQANKMSQLTFGLTLLSFPQ